MAALPRRPAAVARGDEYLWGRDILVAPVVEKGATSAHALSAARRWYDFWTGARLEGGREITRAVDLATMPLYVRAGAIIPTGPVKQHTAETVGCAAHADDLSGSRRRDEVYEDDGVSFAHETGTYRTIAARWHDAERRTAW